MSENNGVSERILVLAPIGQDAQLACEVLGGAGLLCTPCRDIEDLSQKIEHGAAAALVTEEVLTPAALSRLVAILEGQPAWSDLSLVFLVGSERRVQEIQRAIQAFGPDSNVTILKRPLPNLTLVTIMQSAVHARKRQYEVRQYLAEREQLLREAEEAYALLDALFDLAPVGLAFVDRQLRFVRLNKALAEMNGLPIAAHLGRTPRELLPDIAGLEEVLTHWQRILETGQSMLGVEVSGKTPGGPNEDGCWLESWFPVSLRGQTIGLGVVVEDVTEQKQAEEQLRQVRQQLEKRVEERTAELVYVNATLVEQIEERERVEERLKRRNQELATLNMVTAAVSSSLDLPQVFETLKMLLVEQLDIPGGAIFFYNELADQLELRASWNLPQNVIDAFETRGLDDSHLARVVRRQEIIFWSDFRELDLFVKLGLNETRPAWQSHMCVPLLAKGKIQGVLDLFSRAPTVFAKEQAVFFLTLGRQVGVAIQNARLFDEVDTKRERLHHLTQQVVKAQEEERQRVARELHDEAGQALTALKISLNMTRAGLPLELTRARRNMAEAVTLTDETMERIRLLAQNLRPPSLDHIGLNATLEGLCHESAQRTRLPIEYMGTALPFLPGSVAIVLYRVVQEALTNVARHANATRVQVTLAYHTDIIELSVSDDGRGFDLRASKSGVGLSGMRERIELFGGWLTIDTASGQGTNIVATLPWPEVSE